MKTLLLLLCLFCSSLLFSQTEVVRSFDGQQVIYTFVSNKEIHTDRFEVFRTRLVNYVDGLENILKVSPLDYQFLIEPALEDSIDYEMLMKHFGIDDYYIL